jgi:hypothetical protein
MTKRQEVISFAKQHKISVSNLYSIPMLSNVSTIGIRRMHSFRNANAHIRKAAFGAIGLSELNPGFPLAFICLRMV